MVMTASRVIPASTEVSGGVRTIPSRITNTFSPLPSATKPSVLRQERLVVAVRRAS